MSRLGDAGVTRWHTHDFGAGRVHMHDHPNAAAGHVHAPCEVVVDEKGQRMYLPDGQRWPGEVTPMEQVAAMGPLVPVDPVCRCACHTGGARHVAPCC